MTLHQLRVFCAVAMARSVSGAARSLFLTQPSVSAQLRSLEKSVGTRLYFHERGQLTLTEAGRVLLRYAETITRAEDEATRALSAIQAMNTGLLRVGANTTGGMYIVPPILKAFIRQYADVKVALSIGITPRLLDELSEGSIDIAVVPGPIEDRQFKSLSICTDRVVMIASPQHELARVGEPVTSAALSELEIVLPSVGSRTRWLVETHLRAKGIPIVPGLSMAGTEEVKKAVEANLGVGFVSGYSIANELQCETLQVIEVTDMPLVRSFEVVWHEGDGEPRMLREFYDCALEVVGRLNVPA